jgi:hypothetical protein
MKAQGFSRNTAYEAKTEEDAESTNLNESMILNSERETGKQKEESTLCLNNQPTSGMHRTILDEHYETPTQRQFLTPKKMLFDRDSDYKQDFWLSEPLGHL